VTEIYANADEARRSLGWSAQHSVENAILDAWNWEQKRFNE
jgi:UDP-glucose 4-epimerase